MTAPKKRISEMSDEEKRAAIASFNSMTNQRWYEAETNNDICWTRDDLTYCEHIDDVLLTLGHEN